MKRSLRAGVGFDLSGLEPGVDVSCRLFRVCRFVQPDLVLCDRTDQVEATRPLEEVEMAVDVVLLGSIAADEDPGDRDIDFTDREFLTHLDAATASQGLPDDGGVLVILEFIPVAIDKFEIAHLADLLRERSIEHNHVETGPAVVGENLYRHDILNARHAADDKVIILRQMTRRRTELVGLEDDQDRVVLTCEPLEALLHGQNEAEYEQGDG